MRGLFALAAVGLALLPAAAHAQAFDELFNFSDLSIDHQRVVSDGVRNSYIAGVLDGQLFVEKLDEFGTQVWSTVLPDTTGAKVFKIILDANQDIYIAATIGSTDKFSMVVSLRRVDGSVRWTNLFDSAENNALVDIAAAKSGNSILLYELTNTRVSATDEDIIARRINPASGAEVWKRQLGTTFVDKPVALAVNPTGAPFLAATLQNFQAFAFRLSGTDGSTVWSHQQASFTNVSEQARGLAVLSDGRIGFTFDAQDQGQTNFGGAEFLEGTNGSLAGNSKFGSSISSGTVMIGIAPTSRGTFVTGVNKGNSVVVGEIKRVGSDFFPFASTDLVHNISVDASNQFLFNITAFNSSLQRAPGSPANFVTGFDPKALDIDNKDQIIMVGGFRVLKVRQRAQAVSDTFRRPIVAGVMSVPAPGVLGNDGGLTGATAEVVQQPAKGTLVFNGNGSFSYTPGATFTGSDSFKYRVVKDGFATTATVNLNELKLTSHTLPSTAFGGDDVVGNIVFNGAPDPDLLLEITDNSSAVTSPAPAPMPFSSNVGYTLKSLPVNGQFTVTVTLKVQSIVNVRTFTIKPGGIKDLTAFKTNLVAGEDDLGVVHLTGPRTATITLSVDDAIVTVPDTVSTGGADQAAFFFETDFSQTNRTVTMTATLGATTKTLVLNIARMPRASVLKTFGAVVGGETLVIEADLDKTSPYDLDVNLSRAPNVTALTVPATSKVAHGKNFTIFEASTAPVTADVNITVTAKVGGGTATKVVKVIRNPLDSVTVSPTSMIGGTAGQGTVHLNNLAPADGLQVSLFVNGTDIDIPNTIRVSSGSWSADFQILTKPVTANESRTITARMGVLARTATFTVTK